MSIEDFIKKSNIIHNNKYDYSKVCYKNNMNNIIIICPIHGEFEQLPLNHLKGCGCPFCRSSKLEIDIRYFLQKNNIKYIEQVHSNYFKWLGRQSLDFYLPDHNIAIECQGIQHFDNKMWFGKDNINDEYIKLVKRDILKKQLCEENNIKLLYYSNLNINYPYEVFEDEEKLLEEIKKN